MRRGAGGARARAVASALVGTILATAGCATRGPLHVYTVGAADGRPILDSGDGGPSEVPSFLEADDRLCGFAYDPFTDHFFLRLEPGHRLRVVDRPARAIKREFEIAGAPPGGGDLAVCPRDGHLFLLGPQPGQVLETTRLGKFVGEFTLGGATGRATGLAFDSRDDRLLALAEDGRRVTLHDRRGQATGEVRLEQAAGPGLAFDSDRREYYAPLRDRPGEIGVFATDGRRVCTLPGAPRGGFLDVGPRSFLRVF